jgi:hypothetical protein
VASPGAVTPPPSAAASSALEAPPAIDPLAIPWTIECQLSPWMLARYVELALARAGTPTAVIWAGTWGDEQPIDLSTAPSLRALLDEVARTHGPRWNWQPGRLLLDRPLADDERARLFAALRASRTAVDAAIPARAIAASLDLVAVHDMLVFAADAPAEAGDAMVGAYGETWHVPYTQRQLPLPLDAALVDALTRRWRALTPGRLRIIDMILAGQAGVQEARPRLQAILTGADPVPPQPADGLRRAANDQYRVSAALALAWLGDRSAQAPILAWTAGGARTRTQPPLYTALGHLGPPLDPEPLLARHAIADYEDSVLAGIYFALAKAAPPEAIERFIDLRKQAMGEKAAAGAFLGGFGADPMPAVATALCDAFAVAKDIPSEWSWFPEHMAWSIPPSASVPALRSALPRAADPSRRRSLIAGLAVAGEQAAITEILAEGAPDLVTRQRLHRLAMSNREVRQAVLARVAARDVLAGEIEQPFNQPVMEALAEGIEGFAPPLRQHVRVLLARYAARGPFAAVRARILDAADPAERCELARRIPAGEAREWLGTAEGVELRAALLARLLDAGGEHAAVALDQLEASGDAALCARVAGSLNPYTRPRSSLGRRAALLARWMADADRALRLAAVNAAGEQWMWMLCTGSPLLIRELRARCADADGSVAEAAQHALDKCRGWTTSGIGWGAATWQGAVQGQFDDLRLLDDVDALLVKPAQPTMPSPSPSLPPAQDF